MAFAPIWGTCHTTLLSMAAQRGLKGYDYVNSKALSAESRKYYSR